MQAALERLMKAENSGDADLVARAIEAMAALALLNRETPTIAQAPVVLQDDRPRLPEDALVMTDGVSLQALIDLVPDYLWVKDAKSRFVIANRTTAAQLGRASPRDLIGKTDVELHPTESAEKFLADERRIIETGCPMIDQEEFVLSPAGATIWISTTKVPLRSESGEIVGLFGVSRDITARKKADQFRDGQAQILEMIALSAPLQDVLEKLLQLIESQVDGVLASILLVDEAGDRLRFGAAPSLPPDFIAALDGLEIGPNAGSCATAAHRRQPVVVGDIANDPLWAPLRDVALGFGLRSCWSMPLLSHLGEVRGTFALYAGTPRTPTPEEQRLIDLASRVAGIAIERKLAEDRIHYMATHDPLTGLPDRAVLSERLTQAIALADRYDRMAALAFVDLDHFKAVNDGFGHKAGDELLKTVARRMGARLSAADTIMRIGGDEFVIVLCDKERDFDALAAALEGVRAAIAEPIHFEGHALQVASSVGVACYPRDAATADALLANADAAMYHAKELGRNRLQFYAPALNAKAREKSLLHEQLREAVARGEFTLHFQPQFDLKSGALLAVEALIRWNHPERGLLAPDQFMPLAEETGLIGLIGEWVLGEACRQNKAWQERGFPPIRVCVNVSARQFADKRLVDSVAAALADSGLEPRCLELELTESLVMRDVRQAVAVMKALTRLGVQLSIDDFGAGYSSLGALKTFPVARLKIDRSLIQGLPDDDEDAAVTSSVISLARKLNLKVIAEGVENERQSAFLAQHRCDEIQGYLSGRPAPVGEIEAVLAAARGRERA